ncbi:hypothetical protein [Shinella sp. BYT-45]|uniref:hypothetical protein n=1 Tax=Shinella sp. BYT-45 TaxID=3377377 RepID=UPI003980CE1E
MSEYPDLIEAFRRAPVTYLASAASRDGTPIAAKDDDGEVHLVRWKTGADLEEGEEPYWAIYETDEPIEIVEWIPSPLTVDEILKLYG